MKTSKIKTEKTYEREDTQIIRTSKGNHEKLKGISKKAKIPIYELTNAIIDNFINDTETRNKVLIVFKKGLEDLMNEK